tara:strand:+ start:41 stop:1279 length:1239 start_codon:yes stop_codon:yes gene_type:complete
MASLLDYYFSDPNAGQNRRSALDGILGRVGDSADYYLGPTGVPDRARSAGQLVDMASPVSGALRSMGAAGRGNYGEAALEAAGVLAPAGIARMAGPIGQNAGRVASEMLTGVDSIGQAAAKSYMLGDRLTPSSGYTGAGGKPSTVGLPDGQRYDAKPINAIEQSARDYMQSRGMDTSAFDEYPEFSEERGRLIAAAYDMMPHDPSDPLVARSYDAMIQETIDQYNSLKNSGVEFKFLKEGMDDPYAASPALGYQDLVENGQLYVYPTDFGFGSDAAFDPSTNPLLKSVGRVGDKDNAVANDAFRAVHDAYGHFGGGNPFFRRQGEERAFLEHSRMYSPEARGAMASETRGQNSWVNSGPNAAANRSASGGNTVFADQKAGLMAPWASEVSGMPNAEQRGLLEAYIRANKWQE